MTSGDITPDAPMPPTASHDVGIAHMRWWDALLAADAGALDTLLADDVTFHSPYGTAETKAAFLAHLRAGVKRLYHGAQAPCCGDSLQAGNPGSQDQHLGRRDEVHAPALVVGAELAPVATRRTVLPASGHGRVPLSAIGG